MCQEVCVRVSVYMYVCVGGVGLTDYDDYRARSGSKVFHHGLSSENS